MFAQRLVAAALVVMAPAVLAAQRAPVPSFEEVLGLRIAGSAEISPDGRHVAFSVRTTDWEANRFDTELWLSRDGGEPFQLTRTSKGNSGSPRWSPEGRWIGFLTDRGDKQQIYVISLAGGEAVQVTSAANGVSDFAWSPDGTRIAFTATEPESPAMKQRKEKYGDFAPEDEDWSPSHLWMVPFEPEALAQDRRPEATRLTEGTAFTVGSFDWSPDGTRIVFDHRRDPLINSWVSTDISMLTLADRSTRLLVGDPGSDAGPTWSPDGQWILYTTSGGDTTSNYYRNNRLMKLPVAGGTAVRLGVDFDEQIGGVTWTPQGIYFVGWQHTDRRLFRVDPERGTTQVVAGEGPRIGGASFSRDGSAFAFVGAGPTSLGEVYLARLAPYAPRALTSLTRQIAGWDVGSPEVVAWRSRDGAEIEGILYKPAGFDPARKYPLFVVIHGGPTGIDIPQPPISSVYPMLQWLARGALVLRPNYRGSAGYGEAFRSLNVKNLGVGDMWDVMTGVNHLIRQGSVDTTRMGAMGWSQGGYISAFLTTNTNRFRAISVGAGISNWVTYYVATDVHPFTRQYLKATPWNDPQLYAKTSPMTSIKQAATPTLIQHGEFDRRVPIQNAYELFQGLQDQGVPTRLIVYKGFGHGISKPKEQLAALTHNWEWFGKYVWGDAGATLSDGLPSPDR